MSSLNQRISDNSDHQQYQQYSSVIAHSSSANNLDFDMASPSQNSPMGASGTGAGSTTAAQPAKSSSDSVSQVNIL